MSDLHNNVNDLNLRQLLLSNHIDEEELLFESNGNVVCAQSGIVEKTEGILFATNLRMGFITAKGDRCFYSSNMNLRDVLSDDDEKLIQLIFAEEDYQNYTKYDYYIDYYALDDYVEFFKSTFDIMNMRFKTPMKCITPLIDGAVKSIYENNFDEAIKMLDKANALDMMTGVVDLLKARILKMMGESKQAAIMLAKDYEWYISLSVKFVMSEFLDYEWTPAAVRYLPTLDECVGSEHMLVKALIAKSENRYSDFVIDICNAVTELKANNYYCNEFEVLSKLIFEYSNKNTENTLKQTCQDLVKAIEENEQSNEDEDEDEDLLKAKNMIIEFFRSYQEEPIKAFKNFLCFFAEAENNRAYQLFLREEFLKEEYHELLKMSFDSEELKMPNGYTLDELSSFIPVDNHTAYCESLVVRIFAALRNGEIGTDKIHFILLELNKKIIQGNNRFLLSPTAIVMLYYICCCETNIKNGLLDEALENIKLCRKAIGFDFGNYSFVILKYGKNMMRFYEAWALGSFAEMENSISDIPREDMVWIHELCLSVGKDLRIRAGSISSADAAIRHIKILSNNFVNISQFDDVNSDNKNQINEYLKKIKLRLNENELRIAVVGETSTGKTTFLNTLFNTDLFFTTQEEATGVPTEIRRGMKTVIEVLDKKGKIISGLNSEFIAKHTKVGESSLDWVDKVRVRLPIEDLPDNAVIIDTPGFNASYERAEIARRVIAEAHVCIFIIDARNALKNKEMEILQMVRAEAGKTFFVLNKIDLVFSDDDLDCDGEDSVEMTLQRVELDLKRYFNLKDVMLYPVCSIPREQAKRDALKYCDNLVVLKEDIFKEAVIKKVELLVDMSVKEAVALSNNVIKIGENLISNHLEIENRLLQSIPVDPELFKNKIEKRVLAYYYSDRSRYIDIIVEAINSELKLASDSFYNWIAGVSSKTTLKSDTQSKAETSINEAVKRIENARKRELNKLSSNVINEIKNTFSELYSNLPFKASFESNRLSGSLSTLNLSINGGLQGTINNISDDISQETTAAVVGAAVGMLLGPLGAIAGGFLGGLLFGTPIEEMKDEVWKGYCETIDKTSNKIHDVYDKDISNENTQSYVNKLIHIIDVEIERYNSEIASHISIHNENMKKVNGEIIKLKRNAYSIMDEIQVLQKWREQRDLN